MQLSIRKGISGMRSTGFSARISRVTKKFDLIALEQARADAVHKRCASRKEVGEAHFGTPRKQKVENPVPHFIRIAGIDWLRSGAK
jgi:hypothetical protein